MAADPNIIFQIGKGVTPLLSPAEIQNQQLERESGMFKMNALRQSAQDDAAYRNVLRSGATPDQIPNRLMSAGLGKQGMEYQKFQSEQRKSDLDQRKTQVEIGSKTNEALGGPLKFLADNPSLETADTVFSHLTNAGLMTPQQVASARQQIQSDPTPDGIKRFAMMGVQAAISADKQATLENQRRGQDITMRGQDMLQDTSLRNNAATIANSANTAQMTDARARDFNATKVEENKIKRDAKQDTADMTKAGQVASFDTMLGTLDRLTSHPGLKNSVGLVGKLPTMPGSESANFQAELNTFQSQAFVPMVAQLKGMGALSDAEGKKLTAAVGALDPNMGEKAFRESIERIKGDMNAARARVVGNKATATPSPGQNAANPKLTVGLVQGGYRYKGGDPNSQASWEPVK